MKDKGTTYQFITGVFLMLLFLGLFLLTPQWYTILSNEDQLFEYLSALGLVVTGFYLLQSGLVIKKSKVFPNRVILSIVFMAVGVLFFVAAGEEISWGQRIFDLPTPDFLQPINDQGELNLHNIDKKFFDRVVDRGILVFVLITSFFLLRKQQKLWGIPLPDGAIICLFALTAFYQQYSQWTLDFYNLNYLALIALLWFGIKSQDSRLIGIVSLVVGLSILVPIIHTMYQDNFHAFNNSANEYREFLFALACVFYSRNIYKNLIT